MTGEWSDCFGLELLFCSNPYLVCSFTPVAKGSFGFEDNSEWKVKIHCTLVNTRHRDELQQTDNENGGAGANGKGANSKLNRSKMDVTNIMEKYRDYDFGVVTLDQLHICTHRCYDPANDDYCFTIAMIDL